MYIQLPYPGPDDAHRPQLRFSGNTPGIFRIFHLKKDIMVTYPFHDVFSAIARRHEAMLALQRFAAEHPQVAGAAEAIRQFVAPLRNRHDGWLTHPDGRSRPGMPVDPDSVRAEVRKKLGADFRETDYREALLLCTVNSRSRARYYAPWEALQNLVAGEPQRAERVHAIRCYYDLLLHWTDDSLRTAPTRSDPLFRMHRDAESGEVRVGRLISAQNRVKHHFYLLEVYGGEPVFTRLKNGDYLYFYGPELVD